MRMTEKNTPGDELSHDWHDLQEQQDDVTSVTKSLTVFGHDTGIGARPPWPIHMES